MPRFSEGKLVFCVDVIAGKVRTTAGGHTDETSSLAPHQKIAIEGKIDIEARVGNKDIEKRFSKQVNAADDIIFMKIDNTPLIYSGTGRRYGASLSNLSLNMGTNIITIDLPTARALVRPDYYPIRYGWARNRRRMLGNAKFCSIDEIVAINIVTISLTAMTPIDPYDKITINIRPLLISIVLGKSKLTFLV